jgi:hypothetical protein
VGYGPLLSAPPGIFCVPFLPYNAIIYFIPNLDLLYDPGQYPTPLAGERSEDGTMQNNEPKKI